MNRWLAALAALTALRLVVAAVSPLSPDEAYYWLWAQHLQPGYLDHPPMVAVFIWLGTALCGDTALGIRLLAPLTMAAGSLMLAQAGNLLFPQTRAGYWAAAFLNASLLAGLGAVTMTPDTPLLFFWTATLWAVVRARDDGRAGWWILAGLFGGLALASKYTAAFLWLGLFAWLVTSREARHWLAKPAPWLGGLAGLLVFAPVIAWNAANGWASFAKQGGRTVSRHFGADTLRWMGELVLGQVGLASPIIFAFCCAGIGAVVARLWRRRDDALLLLAALTLPAALTFLWQSTGGRVQGNWPAILYPAAAIAAAALLQGKWLAWRRPALAVGLVMSLAAYLQATAAPLPLPRSSDPTLARLAGWDGLAAGLAQRARAEGAGFIAVEEYGLASQLAFRLPVDLPVVALDARWRYFRLPPAPTQGQGLLIRSERRNTAGEAAWPGAAMIAGAEGTLLRQRRGITAEAYRLYRIAPAPEAGAVLLGTAAR